MTIGQKLKEFGETKFKSVTDFAEALGIKREQLYPYYNNTSIPGGEILKRLSELGCDINWLLTGKKNSIEVTILKDGKEKYENKTRYIMKHKPSIYAQKYIFLSTKQLFFFYRKG